MQLPKALSEPKPAPTKNARPKQVKKSKSASWNGPDKLDTISEGMQFWPDEKQDSSEFDDWDDPLQSS